MRNTDVAKTLLLGQDVKIDYIRTRYQPEFESELRVRTMMCTVHACLLFLFLFLGACGAPSETFTASRQNALIGGIDDDGDRAAVLVVIKAADGMEGLCTGTVIGPRTVLTAAHCVAPQVVRRDATFSIFLGTDFRTGRDTPGLTLDVVRVDFDSAFDADLLQRGHDIGVLYTAAPIGITPVPLRREPLSNPVFAVRVIGFGVSSAMDLDGTTAGRRRQVSFPVLEIRGKLIDIGLEGKAACLGDSGGPAFSQASAGAQELLTGIVSYSPTECSGITTLTAVPSYLPLVDGWLSAENTLDSSGCSMSGSQRPRGQGLTPLAWMLCCIALLLRRRAARFFSQAVPRQKKD